jgi:hypothetical protein
MAANNITFLNVTSLFEDLPLRAAFFHLRPTMSTPFSRFFTIFLKLLNNLAYSLNRSLRLYLPPWEEV